MKAAILYQFNSPLKLVDNYPKPKLGLNDVLIKVRACGVCGSDLLLIKGHLPPKLPIIPGHEASGEVVKVGKLVRGFKPGDRVAIYYIQHCNQCYYCQIGRPNICKNISRMGVDFDGAFAQHVRVPADNLIPLPSDVNFEAGAVLTDAVATPYHALKDIARLQVGESVAVFGIGGIGSNAVQIARISGAVVIAISRSESKLELALKLGAHHAIKAGEEDVIDKIKSLTDGDGVDVAIQCVGDAKVDEQALASIKKGGRVILVGGTAEKFQVNSLDMIWREATIKGSRGFTKQNIKEVIALFSKGQISVEHLTSNIVPLEEVNRIIEDFREGKVFRAILIPN